MAGGTACPTEKNEDTCGVGWKEKKGVAAAGARGLVAGRVSG
jgi:hypothetical protein